MKLLQWTTIIGVLILLPTICRAEEDTSTVSASPYEEAPQFNPIPLDEGEAAPLDGLLIDERTGMELALLRASDLRLRTELEVRLDLWEEQETIYENALASLQSQVETLTTELAGREPSWWNRYGGVVLGTIGFVVGAAVTILVAWAVAEAVTPDTVTAE